MYRMNWRRKREVHPNWQGKIKGGGGGGGGGGGSSSNVFRGGPTIFEIFSKKGEGDHLDPLPNTKVHVCSNELT